MRKYIHLGEWLLQLYRLLLNHPHLVSSVFQLVILLLLHSTFPLLGDLLTHTEERIALSVLVSVAEYFGLSTRVVKACGTSWQHVGWW